MLDANSSVATDECSMASMPPSASPDSAKLRTTPSPVLHNRKNAAVLYFLLPFSAFFVLCSAMSLWVLVFCVRCFQRRIFAVVQCTAMSRRVYRNGVLFKPVFRRPVFVHYARIVFGHRLPEPPCIDQTWAISLSSSSAYHAAVPFRRIVCRLYSFALLHFPLRAYIYARLSLCLHHFVPSLCLRHFV